MEDMWRYSRARRDGLSIPAVIYRRSIFRSERCMPFQRPLRHRTSHTHCLPDDHPDSRRPNKEYVYGYEYVYVYGYNVRRCMCMWVNSA